MQPRDIIAADLALFTAPTLEYAAPVERDCQCARCGSSCGWIDCSDCLHGVITTEDDEGLDVVEHCSTCGGCGGWWCCLSSAEWCAANPVPGREHVARGSVEWFDVPPFPSTTEVQP